MDTKLLIIDDDVNICGMLKNCMKLWTNLWFLFLNTWNQASAMLWSATMFPLLSPGGNFISRQCLIWKNGQPNRSYLENFFRILHKRLYCVSCFSKMLQKNRWKNWLYFAIFLQWASVMPPQSYANGIWQIILKRSVPKEFFSVIMEKNYGKRLFL